MRSRIKEKYLCVCVCVCAERERKQEHKNDITVFYILFRQKKIKIKHANMAVGSPVPCSVFKTELFEKKKGFLKDLFTHSLKRFQKQINKMKFLLATVSSFLFVWMTNADFQAKTGTGCISHKDGDDFVNVGTGCSYDDCKVRVIQ